MRCIRHTRRPQVPRFECLPVLASTCCIASCVSILPLASSLGFRCVTSGFEKAAALECVGHTEGSSEGSFTPGVACTLPSRPSAAGSGPDSWQGGRSAEAEWIMGTHTWMWATKEEKQAAQDTVTLPIAVGLTVVLLAVTILYFLHKRPSIAGRTGTHTALVGGKFVRRSGR